MPIKAEVGISIRSTLKVRPACVLLKVVQWAMAAADQTCTACWTGTLVPQEGGILVCDVCGTQSQVGSCSLQAPSLNLRLFTKACVM